MNKFFRRVGAFLGISKRSGEGAFLEHYTRRGISRVSTSQAMRLSTVYACVDAISSDVAKLPIIPYLIDESGRRVKNLNDPIYILLTTSPNEQTTRFTFLQSLVVSMLLNGDGFASIERDPNTGIARSLHFERYNDITVYAKAPQEGGGIDCYFSKRTGRFYEPNDMIHLLNFTYDGIRGVSTLSHAANVLGISSASDEQAGSFFGNGGTASGVLSFQNTRLDKATKDAIRKEWRENFKGETSGLVVLDGNSSFSPISVNPKDAQLLESRQFNVVEICRFFRISPVKVGDLSKSSYSTVEATNLSYLTDTLSTYLEKIELEFRRKLYPSSRIKHIELKFDTSELIRTDSAARATLLSSLFPYGAFTPNELREAMNLSPIANGDEAYVMVNLQPLSKAVKGANEDISE